MARTMTAERRCQGEGSRRSLDDGPFISPLAQGFWNQQGADRARRSLDEDETIPAVESHHALRPVGPMSEELANRQRIQEFVRNEEHRAIRQILKTRYPDGRKLSQSLFLRDA